MNVVPDGYHTVTPWIITAGRTAELIDFTVAVLDGVELGRVTDRGAFTEFAYDLPADLDHGPSIPVGPGRGC